MNARNVEKHRSRHAGEEEIAVSEQQDEGNIFVVFTDSEEGADEEFNRWYDEHHVHEILGVDGFVWGRRYELHADQRPGMEPPAWKYLTLYGIEGDVPELHEKLAQASPGFVKSASLRPGTGAWVFAPRGSRIERSRA